MYCGIRYDLFECNMHDRLRHLFYLLCLRHLCHGILWHRFCGSLHCLHCLHEQLQRLHIGNHLYNLRGGLLVGLH